MPRLPSNLHSSSTRSTTYAFSILCLLPDTGDRPYRCQHCGDQFARSDLLSRHVNKCHPNEKPLSSTAPARRKGTTSATRATTSKQACDQCVQSSLPCDGANPCSKCMHRKCRCTYVKFHRQTAPLGPGHPSRPNDPNAATLAAAAAAAANLPGGNTLPVLSGLPAIPPSYRLSDSFLLAPNAPAALAAGANPNPLYAADQQFNFQAPAINGNGVAGTYGDDYASRYRAQAEFLSRTGMLSSSVSSVPSSAHLSTSSTSAVRGPDGYPQQHFPHDGRYAAPYPREVPHPVDFGFGTDGKQSTYPRDDEPQYGSLPSNFDLQANGGYGTSSSNYPDYTNLDTRRPSTADSSTGSLPSSASSSSIHLPLPNTHSAYSNSHQLSSSAASSNSYDDHTHQQQHVGNSAYPPDGEGGFSSAFGLMSLDDPAVLAGLSQGTAFFDQPENHESGQPTWSDGITPRPNGNPGTALGDRQASATAERANEHIQGVARSEKPGQQTPGTLRELKDMWRQYMRTPFAGPSLAQSVSTDGAPSAGSIQHDPTSALRSPRRERTIPRVASLPSVKTPGVIDNQADGWTDLRATQMPAGDQGPSFARGSINNPDDLRSYEQAVLARCAPLTLNLVPKRRIGSMPSAGGSQAQQHSVAGASLQAPGAAGSSRPSSSSSSATNSSLAHAFAGGNAAAYERTSSESPSPVPLLHPAYPNAGTEHMYHSAQAAEDARPGFKRLPSQTLAPEYSKRTAVAVAAAPNYTTDSTGVRHENRASIADDTAGSISQQQQRARRMSAPAVRG